MVATADAGRYALAARKQVQAQPSPAEARTPTAGGGIETAK